MAKLESTPLKLEKLRERRLLQHLCIVHPESEENWKNIGRWFIDQKSFKFKRRRIYFDGQRNFYPSRERLWQIYMSLYFGRDQREQIEAIFAKDLEGMVNQPKKVVQELRLRYLDYIMLEKGLKFARRAYLSFNKGGYSMECHNKMIEIESLHEKTNQEVIKTLFLYACKVSGKTEIDVWLNYAEYLIKTNQPSEIDRIYRIALRKLDPDNHPIFKFRFRLLKRRMIIINEGPSGLSELESYLRY